MTSARFRKLALSMPGASEVPHFQRTSFRVGKRIFATMTGDGRHVMVRVHPLERCLSVLNAYPDIFFEFGGWTRRHGALGVRLSAVDTRRLRGLVYDAWEHIPTKQSRTAARRG